ncbi:DUF488 domain-containing protein [Neorhodopirellula lusitana]|uniref:DUF488 domain-containing protein n=1 Tax=Neorhodopirellula lusitana TaxID=445327 RepID=UPI00384FFFB6
MTSRKIEIARAYSLPASNDHYRVLVDRLWPRGVKKETLELDQWAKDLAPSTELRKWFHQDPTRWEELVERYRSELQRNLAAAKDLLAAADGRNLLLIYAAKDKTHNNAIVLRDFLGELDQPGC